MLPDEEDVFIEICEIPEGKILKIFGCFMPEI